MDYTVHGILQARILYRPWESPGHNTGLGSYSLLQEISRRSLLQEIQPIGGGSFTNWATKEAWTKDKSVQLTEEYVFH